MTTTPNLPNLFKWLENSQDPEFAATSALCYAWDTIVAPEVAPNACFLAGRLATHVLNSIKIPAIAIPTRVMAMNNTMYDHQNKGVHYSQWDESAWSVGAGYEPTDALKVDNRNGRGYNGHVVVMTPSRFLDITANQFSRPERGIDTFGSINEWLTDINFNFSFDAIPNISFVNCPIGEGHILYEFSEDYGFEHTRDWQSNFMRYVYPVLRLMDKHANDMFLTFGTYL